MSGWSVPVRRLCASTRPTRLQGTDSFRGHAASFPEGSAAGSCCCIRKATREPSRIALNSNRRVSEPRLRGPVPLPASSLPLARAMQLGACRQWCQQVLDGGEHIRYYVTRHMSLRDDVGDCETIAKLPRPRDVDWFEMLRACVLDRAVRLSRAASFAAEAGATRETRT